MRYGVLIQNQLRRVGAQVDFEPLEGGAAIARQQTNDFDATLSSWQPDASLGGAKEVWATSAIRPEGHNVGRYSNPHVDALLDSALTTPDLARARSFVSKAYQQIIDDAPAVWLYDVVTLGAVNRRITVTPCRPDAYWSSLADWSIPPNARNARDRIGLAPGSQ